MKIFIGSLVIFFSTLLAAGLVALGQPGAMDVAPSTASPAAPGTASSDNPPRGEDSGWERLLAIRGFH